LLALGCDLTWATAWMHDANEVIAPRVGLPELPVVDLPDCPEDERPGVPHWKISALLRTAAGRPFAWIDDEITDPDRAWVEAHHPAPVLLHRVDPTTGLTDADFAVLTDWLRTTVDPA
jgi:hypothetical protein